MAGRTLGVAAVVVSAVFVLAGTAFGAGSEPTYLTPTDVNGDASEWIGTPVFADLFTGVPNSTAVAQLSLRYDCTTHTLYALVQAVGGSSLQTVDPSEAYLKVDGPKVVSGLSGNNGTPPDFAWVAQSGDTAAGFEASASVGLDSHNLRVHAKIPAEDVDGYQTIDILGRTVPLQIKCLGESTAPPEGGVSTGGGGGGGAVKPVVAQVIDLAIAKSDSPDPAQVGQTITYTETVTNNGPAAATGVVVTDVLPSQVSWVSSTTTAGTCLFAAPTVTCNLGTLAALATATITIVATANTPGQVTNEGVVVGNESESDMANNRASATTLVQGPFAAPRVCGSLKVSTKALVVGKHNTFTVYVRDRKGKALGGAKVTINGPGWHKTLKSNKKGIVKVVVTPATPGIVQIRAAGGRGCATRVGVLGAFQPPVTG